MKRTIQTTTLTILGCLLAGVALGQEWGDLSGTFIYDGPAPDPQPLAITKDQQVCGKHKLVDESLVVNPDNGGVKNVILYMYLGRTDPKPPVHEDYAESENSEVVLDNKNCRFEPHVALVRTSQTVVLGNSDPVGHNTKVDTFSNTPINPIIPAGAKLQQTFSVPERLPSRVSCSIHPWMNAWLVIKDNPYFAVTDKDGKFEIKNLPVGTWTFQVWQEKAGYVQQVNLAGAPTEWARGRFEIEIEEGPNDMGTIKVAPAVFEKE